MGIYIHWEVCCQTARVQMMHWATAVIAIHKYVCTSGHGFLMLSFLFVAAHAVPLASEGLCRLLMYRHVRTP